MKRHLGKERSVVLHRLRRVLAEFEDAPNLSAARDAALELAHESLRASRQCQEMAASRVKEAA